MLLTALFIIVVLVGITAAVACYRLGNNGTGEHQVFGQMERVNDFPVVSSKRELPDAAASFFFIMVMATIVQRSNKKQNR